MNLNTAQPTPFLIDKSIYLRPLVEADAGGPYPSWFNDEAVCLGNSHHVFPYTSESALRYIRQVYENRTQLVLAIVLRKGDVHIGNIALQHIHPVYHTAEFSIIIGDKSAWGSGVGKEAGRLICDHGFNAMNLHRIACGTFENNIPMQRLAQYLGMVKEGVRRKAAFKDGGYLDIIEYGVLKEEYLELWSKKERND
jgi:ribosomal-protein-alanine N-acetyltransferase